MRWILRVAGHPVKGVDGDHEFDRLDDMERFIGKRDVQRDMIKRIQRIQYGKTITYKVTDMVHIATTRLIMDIVDTKYYLEPEPSSKGES